MHPSFPLVYGCRQNLSTLAFGLSMVPGGSHLLAIANDLRESEERGPDDYFHFSRYQMGNTLLRSMARHEHRLFGQLSLKPSMRVLAIGCGTGMAVRELAHFSDVHVVGIDTDYRSIEKARVYAKQAKLSHRVQFFHVDELCDAFPHFMDESFDGAFAIELALRSPPVDVLYAQVKRVLKLGAKVSTFCVEFKSAEFALYQFAIYAWCLTDSWNPACIEHQVAVERIMDSLPNDAPKIPLNTVSAMISQIRTVGFDNIICNDLSMRQDHAPWFRFLEEFQKGCYGYPIRSSWWFQNSAVEALLAAGRMQGLKDFQPDCADCSREDGTLV
ncbi:S-adenosyl-L-methionine-dependent methyltransferase [Hygrophoropsis aurantiaca]|uniref:S-adenosyl-L-methionine-dependent methyltransferase n=1 Tax=Hygrophoropsis aurantiaca TaxID=72124 RepID=A0ACB7ZZG4_9AGAM|nr:S-adenosyl-L-methionine-dependent methyltransferase [Hygrophoropsis aurantiaca]